MDARTQGWLDALERRCLRDLTFQEVRRALQALSSIYVERRGARLEAGRALDGRGKRAAFALFYGPLHFLVVREVVRRVGMTERLKEIIDLGCGTGVASAAWALEGETPSPRILGIDKSAWALGEARWTWATLGLKGRTTKQEAAELPAPGRDAGVVAAYAINELPAETRTALLARLLGSARECRLLVVEPLARRVAPWWPQWRDAVIGMGGREDEWRFPVDLPPSLRRLDRAAGLDHSVLKARSLFI